MFAARSASAVAFDAATWNGQEAAFKYYVAILGVLIFVNQPEREIA